jgi:hypothetical protein
MLDVCVSGRLVSSAFEPFVRAGRIQSAGANVIPYDNLVHGSGDPHSCHSALSTRQAIA